MVPRTPPADVLRQLREAVGFHCPAEVDGDICGNPYLTWHHFDPPWRIEQHHRPDGMIALCRVHADKADNGSYTADQLRKLKRDGRGRGREISGRFDWMRQELLAVIGGNAYLRTPTVLQIGGQKAIWFNRNADNELLLNFVMPTLALVPRASIRDNGWVVQPYGVSELICPPSGRRLRVKYANGDLFDVEFKTITSRAELAKTYAYIPGLNSANFEFPLTVANLSEVASGSNLQFSPTGTMLGTNSISGSFMSDCGVGIVIGGLNPAAEPPQAEPFRELLRQAREIPWYSG